jgi:hypothetical protein
MAGEQTGGAPAPQDDGGKKGSAPAAGGVSAEEFNALKGIITQVATGLQSLTKRVEGGLVDQSTMAGILDDVKKNKPENKDTRPLAGVDFENINNRDLAETLVEVMSSSIEKLGTALRGEMKQLAQGIQQDKAETSMSQFKKDHKEELTDGVWAKMVALAEENPGHSLEYYLDEVKRPALEKELADFRDKEKKEKEELETKFDVKNLPSISDESIKEIKDGTKPINEVAADLARKVLPLTEEGA